LKQGSITVQDEILKIYTHLGSFLNKSKNKIELEKSISYF